MYALSLLRAAYSRVASASVGLSSPLDLSTTNSRIERLFPAPSWHSNRRSQVGAQIRSAFDRAEAAQRPRAPQETVIWGRWSPHDGTWRKQRDDVIPAVR
jgi:hypothetical protein